MLRILEREPTEPEDVKSTPTLAKSKFAFSTNLNVYFYQLQQAAARESLLQAEFVLECKNPSVEKYFNLC